MQGEKNLSVLPKLMSKKTNLLNFTKGFNGKGSSYLEFFNNQLYLVSANGLVAKTNLESFDSTHD